MAEEYRTEYLTEHLMRNGAEACETCVEIARRLRLFDAAVAVAEVVQPVADWLVGDDEWDFDRMVGQMEPVHIALAASSKVQEERS